MDFEFKQDEIDEEGPSWFQLTIYLGDEYLHNEPIYNLVPDTNNAMIMDFSF